MQRAEAARRSRRRPRGRPHRRAAVATTRHRAKSEVAVQGPGCSSVRPGEHRLSSQGSGAGPEHPSQGRQRCRQRPRRQRQDPELRPTAPPPSPLRTPGRGCQSACSCALWGRSWAGAGWLRLCCLETSGRRKVQKEIKIEAWAQSDSAGILALALSHRSPGSMAV